MLRIIFNLSDDRLLNIQRTAYAFISVAWYKKFYHHYFLHKEGGYAITHTSGHKFAYAEGKPLSHTSMGLICQGQFTGTIYKVDYAP